MMAPPAAASFPAIVLSGDSLIEQAFFTGGDGSGASLADAYICPTSGCSKPRAKLPSPLRFQVRVRNREKCARNMEFWEPK